jgi:hypothetical protein
MQVNVYFRLHVASDIPAQLPMPRAFWLAVAAYLVPTFPLGYIWHLKTFKGAYDRLELYRDAVIIPLGLTSMLIQALAFAWLYPRLFSTAPDRWLREGLTFGALAGVVAWSFTTLPVAAKYRMASVGGFVQLETAFTMVQFAITGPLIALAWRGQG